MGQVLGMDRAEKDLVLDGRIWMEVSGLGVSCYFKKEKVLC